MSATFSQTTGNLIKTCMGVGILALPITTLHTGFVSATLLVALIAFWVYYCMKLLIQVNEVTLLTLLPSNDDPYKIVARKGLGKFGVFLLNFSFIVTLIGVGAAYQITFNQLLSDLHWEVFNFKWGKNILFWTIAFGVCIYPLVLLRTMSAISFASQAGNYILLFVMVCVILYGILHNKPSFAVAMLWPSDYLEIANMFGVICFSMGVAFVSLSSRASMQNPSRFENALIVSLVIPGIVYILFAVCGVIFYANAPEGIKDLILSNIPSSSWFYVISAIGLSLVCFLSYPIAVYPALIALEAWIDGGESKVMVTDWRRVLQRLGVVVVTCLLAYFIPNFKAVVSFNILWSGRCGESSDRNREKKGSLNRTWMLHDLDRVVYLAALAAHEDSAQPQQGKLVCRFSSGRAGRARDDRNHGDDVSLGVPFLCLIEQTKHWRLGQQSLRCPL